MKKFIIMLLATAMFICSSISTFAASVPVNNVSFEVCSATYPDAYIIVEKDSVQSRSSLNSQSISATVFVEETYATDENGYITVTSSRLLSQNEVLAIGIENFNNIGVEREAALNSLQNRSTPAENSRGKLTITFSGEGRYSGTGVIYDLTATADWSSGWAFLMGESNPAIGSDYMGFVWSGGFTSSSSSATYAATPNLYTPPVFNLALALPNMGRVWEFSEHWVENDITSVNAYLHNITAQTTLSKNTLTGMGNTAEAVLQYIHTYGSAEGSISISGSSDGTVAGGFDLSNVNNQWTIACYMTGLFY